MKVIFICTLILNCTFMISVCMLIDSLLCLIFYAVDIFISRLYSFINLINHVFFPYISIIAPCLYSPLLFLPFLFPSFLFYSPSLSSSFLSSSTLLPSPLPSFPLLLSFPLLFLPFLFYSHFLYLTLPAASPSTSTSFSSLPWNLQDQSLSSHGRKMASLPLDPIFAHLLLKSQELGYAF